MSNSIAVVLGIALTFYIVLLIGGIVGIVLLAIIIAMIFVIVNNMGNHDKRFNQIVDLSARHNKETTGKEFNIKPLKFKDELERTRYIHSNYEERNNNRIIILNHYVNDGDYKTYHVVINNFNGEASIYAQLLDSTKSSLN